MPTSCSTSLKLERRFKQKSKFLVVVWWVLWLGELVVLKAFAGRIALDSRLMAGTDEAWVSDNGTFAFGFTRAGWQNQFQLAIWYAQLPGDRVTVWSTATTRNSLVGKDAILELDNTGNLILTDRETTMWMSNTSLAGVETAAMLDSGNFVLYNTSGYPVWQSFSHPSNTLLPGQQLTVTSELTSFRSAWQHDGNYTLKMLQQPTSLSIGLTYNAPPEYNNRNLSSASYVNYSYWRGPEISNITGDVYATLDESGSFSIVYGATSDGVMYVHKNDEDGEGKGGASFAGINSSSVHRRLTLETNGNLRLYRWDNDLNGSRQWVPEWAAVSNPCDIAGACGSGICKLDGSKINASCTCFPGTSQEDPNSGCYGNSSVTTFNCKSNTGENLRSKFEMITVPETSYYHHESSVIANYSDFKTISKCGDVCLSNCECVASVYGLNEEQPYCWVLKSLVLGGFEDPGSTLFVKVVKDSSSFSPREKIKGSTHSHVRVLILPIVVCLSFVIACLCFLLYYSIHRRTSLRRSLQTSVTVSDAPVNFSYRELQFATSNFTQLLGKGGFGSVFKGRLGDGTLVAVKKLERVLPHGEKEFITEVNTIGSMHHMNLVRLCGFCSERSHRLLVYEFMKNGSLDKWIFPSHSNQNRLLDWKARIHIAIATAQGIAYFHEQCRNRIIHCDIKPENILLDEGFCPKVSDFGLAKLMGREHSHVVTMVRGTRGYLAPEWIGNRPITVKADVYSYGMLLLEIIGGRRNLDMSLDAEKFFYPGWAFKELMNGTPMAVADKRILNVVDEEELVRALKVGLWCIQDEVSMRPSMGEVVKMLEGSVSINEPPMPQTILELIEEGLNHVYRAMKREFNDFSSFAINEDPSSQATCSYSTISPR